MMALPRVVARCTRGDDGGGKVENGGFWPLAENDLTTLVSGLKQDRLSALMRMR